MALPMSSARLMTKSDPRYPPAPELQGELLLQVFTHRSLRQEGGSGDNERYAVLGEKVLEASIIHCIFLCHPQFGRKEIEDKMATLLTDQTYETWTNYYRFRDRLRYNSSASDEVNSPQGIREIFHAYIGGVFSQATGPLTVNAWVYRLVVSPQERTNFEGKIPLYFPSQQQSPAQPTYPFPMQPPPPPPPLPTQQFSSPYPPRSRTGSMSSVRNMSTDDLLGGVPSPTPSNGKVVYLPRFNEITTQRRMDVQYPAEQKGLQHAPRWVVKCVVNGTEMGIGAATTKQLAKEEAAKQAFYAMNLSMTG